MVYPKNVCAHTRPKALSDRMNEVGVWFGDHPAETPSYFGVLQDSVQCVCVWHSRLRLVYRTVNVQFDFFIICDRYIEARVDTRAGKR